MKNKDSFIWKFLIGLLFTFLIYDFLVTYLGVTTLGIIEEANPLMIWVLDLPFTLALIYRLVTSFIMIYLINYVRVKDFVKFRILLLFALVVNIIIFIMHFQWLRALYYTMELM